MGARTAITVSLRIRVKVKMKMKKHLMKFITWAGCRLENSGSITSRVPLIWGLVGLETLYTLGTKGHLAARFIITG